MDVSVNRVLEAAVVRILRPLARVLISHGMAEGLFAQLARQAFVEAGFDHMARSGNRPTVSGVAALTGLSRKEVARLAQADPKGDRIARERYNRAVRVISGWVNDTRFGKNGAPAPLRTDGDEPSFATLVRDYSGDVPPAAMLSVLQEGGNVAVDGQWVKLVQRAYIPMQTAPDRLNILGTDVAELILTIAHNIAAEPADRRFQRKVSSTRLRADAVQAFREYSNARSQELLEEYDAWLASREVSHDDPSEPAPAYVAVGIYYSENSDQQE
ncbi:MAG: DUF6502 family protein [Halioglobus sp.]